MGEFISLPLSDKMLASSLTKLRATSRMMTQTRGIKYENLPSFDPAASIPMKWGAVYMGIFMAFWGACYMENPFRRMSVLTSTTQWNGKARNKKHPELKFR